MAEGSRAPLLASGASGALGASGASGSSGSSGASGAGAAGAFGARGAAGIQPPHCPGTLVDYSTFIRQILNVVVPPVFSSSNEAVCHRLLPVWMQNLRTRSQEEPRNISCVQQRMYNGLQDLIDSKLPRLAEVIRELSDHTCIRLDLFLGKLTEAAAKQRLELKERKRVHLRQVHDCLCLLRDVGIESFQYMAAGPPVVQAAVKPAASNPATTALEARSAAQARIQQGTEYFREAIRFAQTRLQEIRKSNNLVVISLDSERLCARQMNRF